MKKLLPLTSLFFLLIYVCILIFAPAPIEYPYPDFTLKDVTNSLDEASESLHMDVPHPEDADFIDAEANNSIGRYVADRELNENQLETLKKEVPLYEITIEDMLQTIKLDADSKKVTVANELKLPINDLNDVDAFVERHFGSAYERMTVDDTSDDIFSEWDAEYVYAAPTTYEDVQTIVEVNASDEYIYAFHQYALAADYPFQDENSTPFILIIITVLLFFITLFIIVTVQLIKRLIKRQIEGFIGPILLTIFAGFGWFFLNSSMGVSVSGFGAVEPAIMTYLTLTTLLIRWKKSSKSWDEQISHTKKAIIQGLLLTVISLTLAELFFLVATHFGGWASPVSNHGLLLNQKLWLLPFFAVFVGISAAITEEAIFRNYMIPFFDRFGVITSVLVTSILWGILHVGYDMYPWYLYIIDFIIISGPFFYFVYKKFGLKTAMFLHYFYNSIVTVMFLFSVDIKVAITSLLLTLAPLLLFFYKPKQ